MLSDIGRRKRPVGKLIDSGAYKIRIRVHDASELRIKKTSLPPSDEVRTVVTIHDRGSAVVEEVEETVDLNLTGLCVPLGEAVYFRKEPAPGWVVLGPFKPI
jgi:hypothetical protein